MVDVEIGKLVVDFVVCTIEEPGMVPVLVGTRVEDGVDDKLGRVALSAAMIRVEFDARPSEVEFGIRPKLLEFRVFVFEMKTVDEDLEVLDSVFVDVIFSSGAAVVDVTLSSVIDPDMFAIGARESTDFLTGHVLGPDTKPLCADVFSTLAEASSTWHVPSTIQ